VSRVTQQTDAGVVCTTVACTVSAGAAQVALGESVVVVAAVAVAAAIEVEGAGPVAGASSEVAGGADEVVEEAVAAVKADEARLLRREFMNVE